MQNYDTALKATTTSENSQGSALQENARYLESAQSKVNALEVAWQEFSLTASKSFMMDGIIFGVNALKDMTNALNAVISLDPSKGNLFLGLGMLTAAMGGLATLMNPTLRGFATQGGALDYLKEKLQAVTAEYQWQQKVVQKQNETMAAMNGQSAQTLTFMDRMKAGTKTAGAGFGVLTSAVGGFVKSLGMMLATSLLVGGGLALVTAGIGWLITKFAAANNEAKELEKKFNAQVKTYSDNKDSIDELVGRYEELRKKTNRTLEETELFYQTQKQLGNYMPELVAKVDAQGRTHLSTAVSIKKHVEELKKLEALKNQEKIDKKKTALDETEKEIQKLKKLEEQNNKAAKAAKELIAEQNKNGNKFGNTGEAYQSAMPKKTGDETSEDRVKANLAIAQSENQLALKSAEVEKSKREIFNLERKQEVGYYSMNKQQREMIDLILDQVDGAELYGKKNKESAETIEDIKDLLADTATTMKDIPPFDEQLFKSGDRSTQLSMINESVMGAIGSIKKLNQEKELLSSKPFLTQAEKANFDSLDQRIQSLAATTSSYVPTLNSMGYSLAVADTKVLTLNTSMSDAQRGALNTASAMRETADGMDDVSDSADMATMGAATLAEQLGYSEEEFSSITGRIQGYNDVLLGAANGHAITADEMMNLVSKMPELASAFKVQNGAIKLNVGAVETLRNAQLQQFKDKVQQQKTELLNGLAESKNFALVAGSKIQSIKSVADAEMLLVAVKEEQVRALLELDKADPNSRGIMHAYDVYTRLDNGAYANYVNQIQQVLGQIRSLDAAAAIITEGMGASIRDLDKANKKAEEQNKKSTKTEKNKQETMTDSVYLTNKYTEAIDKANRALEKQQSRRQKYVKGSKAYSESIKKEIALLKKQIEATKAYEKALEDANKKKKLIPTTGVSNGEVTYVVNKDGKIVEVKTPKDDTYKPPAKKSTGGGNKGGGSKGGGSNPKSSGKSGFVKTGSKKLAGWNGTNSKYGISRTINGKTWVHEGIDLAGRIGERLDSRVNGTVVYAGGKENWEWGVPWQYGNCVVILSGKFLHYHAHLNKIKVSAGQKVGVGQQIGEIGSTGNSTGAHLHYEIRPYKTNRSDGRKSRYGEDIDPTNSAISARYGKKTTYKWKAKSTGAKGSSFTPTATRSGAKATKGTLVSQPASKPSSGSYSAMATKKSPLSYLNRSSNKLKNGSAKGLLKGREDQYEKLGKKYGVDPVLAMAISMAETGRGTSDGIKYKHNVGGMMSPSSNWKKMIQFDNINQGIESHIRNLSRNYKGMTLKQIQKKYAPRNAANDPKGLNKNWLGNVEFFYDQMFYGAGSSSSKKPNSSKKPTTPKTESEAKKKADAKRKAAEKKAALENQKRAERDAEITLDKQKDDLSQLYLDLFTNSADIVRKKYDELNANLDVLQERQSRRTGITQSGVNLSRDILSNSRKQRITTEEEISKITLHLKSKEAKLLTSARRAELTSRLADLRRTLKTEKYEEMDALAELLRDKASLRNRLITNQMAKYVKRNAWAERKSSVLDTDTNYGKEMSYKYITQQETAQKELFKIKRKQYAYELQHLSAIAKKYGTTSQMYKDQLDLVKGYSEELLEIENQIISLNNEQKEMLKGYTEDMISTIKDAIEQRRDGELKALEEVEEKRKKAIETEKNKATNAHEAKLKQIEEEQKKSDEFYDSRLKAMDKEDDTRSNKKQMDEFSKNEKDIRKQINGLALDDSYEAKAKRKELLKQLEDLEKERTDYLYDRNRDKQREALEDEREAYNKSLDKKRESEDKSFEDYMKILDQRSEAEDKMFEAMKDKLNKTYDEILNDEKKWNALRLEMMKGDFKSAETMIGYLMSSTSSIFKDVVANSGKTYAEVTKDMSAVYGDSKIMAISMANDLKKSFKDLASEGGTQYSELGKSIETNLITKLKEVLDLMARLKNEDFNLKPPTPQPGTDMTNTPDQKGFGLYAKQNKSGKGISVLDKAGGKTVGSLINGKKYTVIEQTDKYSKVVFGDGKTGWVATSDLYTSKQDTTYGAGFDDKSQDKILDSRKIIDKFQKDYKYNTKESKKRLSEIKKKTGQNSYNLYLKAMKDKERYVDKREADILAKYRNDYENSKTDAQRRKVAAEFVKSLNDLKAKALAGKKELDALFKDLTNKTKDTKKGTSKAKEDVTLRKDPYYTRDNDIVTVKKGAKVKILGDKGLYYQVETGGKRGYVIKDKIAKFKTGGMTPGNIPESGAMAILHKKELVLTEQQTVNLLNTIKQTDAMMKPMKALWNMMNGMKSKPTIAQRRDDGVMIENIHLDFSNNQIKDGKQGAKEFAKELLNLQQNKFNKRF